LLIERKSHLNLEAARKMVTFAQASAATIHLLSQGEKAVPAVSHYDPEQLSALSDCGVDKFTIYKVESTA
jgi:hypothetical protein